MLNQLNPCSHVALVPRTTHTTPIGMVLHPNLDHELLRPDSEAYLIHYLSTLLDHWTSHLSGISSLQRWILGERASKNVDRARARYPPSEGRWFLPFSSLLHLHVSHHGFVSLLHAFRTKVLDSSRHRIDLLISWFSRHCFSTPTLCSHRCT